MKISELGEFGLIDRITKAVKDKNVVVGIGDDAAVVKSGNKLFCWTVDALVENDHFSLKWFTAKQVGMKAIEINASDIGAMGGKPKYALVSLVLRKELDVKFVDELYKGMREAGKRLGVGIIGGNMTHGREIVVDVTMIGEVKKDNLCLRRNAKPGDFILVSGYLGTSRAGLNLFLNNKIKSKKYFTNIIKAHTEPKSKHHKVKKFLKYINAMIDVSDGLASEVTRICEQSKCGAIIFADNIPIDDETRRVAHLLGENALDYALYGGEDFELVYTVSEKNLSKVKGFIVGEIDSKKGVRIYSKGREKLIAKHGYDHFKR